MNRFHSIRLRVLLLVAILVLVTMILVACFTSRYFEETMEDEWQYQGLST